MSISKKTIIFLVKIFITSTVLVFLFSAVDVRAVLDHLGDVPWWVLVYATLCYLASVYLSSARWALLLRAQEIHIPFARLLFYNLSYSFYSVVLPGGKVAAEAIRIYQIIRDTGDSALREKIVFPTLLDRTMVVIVSALTAGLSFIFATDAVHAAFPWWMSSVGMLIVIAIVLSVFLPVERLVSLVTNIAGPQRSVLQSLASAFVTYRSQPLLIAEVALITLVMNFVIAAGIYGIAISLYLPVSLLLVFAVFSVSIVTAFIPVTVAGIGVREGVFAYVLAVVSGASLEATLSVSLIALVSSLSVVLLGGMVECHRHFIRHLT